MGVGHPHEGPRPRASERTTTILAVCVGVILFVTAMGAAVVWPQGDSFRGTFETHAEGTRWVTATIVEVFDDA